jgi:hypothetical protein
MAKGTISITVDDIDFWREYAKQKGFRTPALLAHVALYQYEARHPGKMPWVRTAGPLEEGK